MKMSPILCFVLSAVLCSLVAGREVSNLNSNDLGVAIPSKDSMVVQFPKKIQQMKKIEKLVIVLNVTLVKGQTLTMSLPVGDSKNPKKLCNTKFRFDKSTMLYVTPNNVNMDKDLREYNLFGQFNMEIQIKQVGYLTPLLSISVLGQNIPNLGENSIQEVDTCNIVNITNFNYVRLQGGFSRLNSMLFKFEHLQ